MEKLRLDGGSVDCTDNEAERNMSVLSFEDSVLCSFFMFANTFKTCTSSLNVLFVVLVLG